MRNPLAANVFSSNDAVSNCFRPLIGKRGILKQNGAMSSADAKPFYEPESIPFSQQRSDLRAGIGRRVGEKLDSTPGLWRLSSARERAVQLYLRGNFVGAEECQELCRQIDAGNYPSPLYEKEKYEGARTSHSCNLNIYDPVVAEIETRIAGLLGIERSWGEPLQGQRYEVGQLFKEHSDFFYVDQPYWPEYESHGGQRTWTAMIYLNQPGGGGATAFKYLDLAVQPQPGRLLIWNNMAPDGSPNPWTMHEGQAVEAGTKYIVTKWYRERVFT
jgi:prolyl 4-hydroxylase